MHKYSEQIIRHEAVTEEGRACEILERVTYERQPAQGGTADQLVVVNRRYDRQTGEPLNRLSESEFEEQRTGIRLRLQR
jgi:hypothetical protein